MRRHKKEITPDPADYHAEIVDSIKINLGNKLDDIDLIGLLSDSPESTLKKDFRGFTINYRNIEFENLNFGTTEDPNVFIISHLLWKLEPKTNERSKSYSMMPNMKIIQGYCCEGFISDITFSIYFNRKTGAPEIDFVDLNVNEKKPYEIKKYGF